jgi:hypothetical protein
LGAHAPIIPASEKLAPAEAIHPRAQHGEFWLFHVEDEAWAIPTRRYLKKSSTEPRRDLNFEGLRPGGVRPGVRPDEPKNIWQNV